MKVMGLRSGVIIIFISALLFTACSSMSRYASKNNIKGIKRLIEDGEDINQYDKWGWTPLMWAMYYNYRDLIEFMIEHGADPNVKTRKDYSSIPAGSTPLHIAAYYEYGSLVRYLLENGAKTNMPNSQGKTAFDYAEMWKFTSIMSMLNAKRARAVLAPRQGGARYYGDESLEFTQGYYVVYLNTGKKIIGEITSQDRKKVVMTVSDRTMTFEKIDIMEIRYNR